MLHHSIRSLSIAAIALCSLADALPAYVKLRALPALEPRASYSVVAVDGSNPTSTGETRATVTIEQTITQTPLAPVTITATVSQAIETALAPITITESATPSTETLLATVTVTGEDASQTLVVTVVPPPQTVSVTDVEVSTIYIQTSISATTGSTSTTSTMSSTPTALGSTTDSAYASRTSTSIYSILTTLSSEAVPTSQTHAATSESCTATSTSSLPTMTSSRTYDNGMWHTTYPAWNSTAPTPWARRV